MFVIEPHRFRTENNTRTKNLCTVLTVITQRNITLLPSASSVQVAPGTPFPTQKCHKRGWLSWSPVAVQLQASFRVCDPRPPLTGPHWPPLVGALVTFDPRLTREKNQLTFASWGELLSKVLSQDPMRVESQWECPAFQPMAAGVSHVCCCPSSGTAFSKGAQPPVPRVQLKPSAIWGEVCHPLQYFTFFHFPF